VEVTGNADNGYVAKRATAATKTNTPILETPMAVQVIPHEIIEDRQSSSAMEVVKNVSGVQSTTQFYDTFLIRGFNSGYGVVFRNGLQLQGIAGAENMAFVDHVEVVKGPASMLYGRIEPGGFINFVTKRPQEDRAYSVQQQVGSWGSSRTTADATGKISDDGSLLYRVIGDYDRGGSWVDNVHHDNKAIAATLAWKPSQRFESNLQLEHYDSKMTWLGPNVPIVGNRPANVSRSFTIVYPISWTDYPYTVSRTLLALDWTYALNDTWKLTNRFHYLRSREDQQGVYASGFNGVDAFTTARFTHSAPGWVRSTYSTNLDLTGEFTTGDIKHKLLVGVDWTRFTDDTPGSTGSLTGTAPLNIFNPAFGNILPAVQALAAADATNVLWRDRSKDTGIYVQDQLALNDRWDVLLGGRYDKATDAYSTDYGSRGSSCYPHCTGQPIVPYPTDRAFSPRAGLLYKVSNAASIYGSYSKSFGMANGRDNAGEKLKPEIGTQYEVGAKASLLGGLVTTSLTLFDLVKSNVAEYDPVNFNPFTVGEVRSRGVEFDIAGQVTRHVSLIGSYTYDDAIISKDTYNGNQGRQFSGVAPHVASLWAKYDTAPGTGQGLSFGVGAYLTAQRQGNDANTWQLPGYGRVDAMLGYRIKAGSQRITAQLNVNNLFDKKYFDNGAYSSAAYGAPRSVTGSVKVDF
jgi:iron complex outermembrane recepter protein